MKIDTKESAGACVFYQNSILLAKRSEICRDSGKPISFPGYWSIFAGALDENESPIHCAKRELFEESKIVARIQELEPLGCFDNQSSKLHLFIYEPNNLIIPEINFEHTAFGWFSIFDLDSFSEKIDHKLIKFIIKRKYKS